MLLLAAPGGSWGLSGGIAPGRAGRHPQRAGRHPRRAGRHPWTQRDPPQEPPGAPKSSSESPRDSPGLLDQPLQTINQSRTPQGAARSPPRAPGSSSGSPRDSPGLLDQPLQSINQPVPFGLDPLTLHFVPSASSGHGGGYVHMHMYGTLNVLCYLNVKFPIGIVSIPLF